mmetsp:Transcript_78049/g.220669  ORF Transcript_78049/g.220669 Transcript_78049/m.220669 type:complete len:500 (-) Transcript_78049:198-1697(-)
MAHLLAGREELLAGGRRDVAGRGAAELLHQVRVQGPRDAAEALAPDEVLGVEVVAEVGAQPRGEQGEGRHVRRREPGLRLHAPGYLVVDGHREQRRDLVLLQIRAQVAQFFHLVLLHHLRLDQHRGERGGEGAQEEGAQDDVELREDGLQGVPRDHEAGAAHHRRPCPVEALRVEPGDPLAAREVLLHVQKPADAAGGVLDDDPPGAGPHVVQPEHHDDQLEEGDDEADVVDHADLARDAHQQLVEPRKQTRAELRNDADHAPHLCGADEPQEKRLRRVGPLGQLGEDHADEVAAYDKEVREEGSLQVVPCYCAGLHDQFVLVGEAGAEVQEEVRQPEGERGPGDRAQGPGDLHVPRQRQRHHGGVVEQERDAQAVEEHPRPAGRVQRQRAARPLEGAVRQRVPALPGLRPQASARAGAAPRAVEGGVRDGHELRAGARGAQAQRRRPPAAAPARGHGVLGDAGLARRQRVAVAARRRGGEARPWRRVVAAFARAAPAR